MGELDLRPAFHVRVSARRTTRRKVACVQLCRPASIAAFPRDSEFRHAEKSLIERLFGALKCMRCVYRHNVNVHDLAEVNMASMDEELFLLILRH